jgi:hypothetical protein
MPGPFCDPLERAHRRLRPASLQTRYIALIGAQAFGELLLGKAGLGALFGV